MKKNKEFTIAQSFALSYIIPGAILFALLVIGGILFSLGAHLESRGLIIAGLVVVLNLAAAYIVFSIIAFFKMRKTYQDGLYKTTASLLRGFQETRTRCLHRCKHDR